MPRDTVSRTANVESNGGHKWVIETVRCKNTLPERASVETVIRDLFKSTCLLK